MRGVPERKIRECDRCGSVYIVRVVHPREILKLGRRDDMRELRDRHLLDQFGVSTVLELPGRPIRIDHWRIGILRV